MGNLLQPIWSNTQIWVATHHQYRTSALIPQSSFCWVTSWVTKHTLFSQLIMPTYIILFNKHCTNGHNSVGQQLPTLWDVKCYVRLHTLLHVVACCWGLNLVKLFETATPNTENFFFCSKAQHNNVGSICIALPTLLGPCKHITHGLQSRWNVAGSLFC